MEEEGARSARSRISNYVTAAAAIAEGRAPRREGTATMKNMVRVGGGPELHFKGVPLSVPRTERVFAGLRVTRGPWLSSPGAGTGGAAAVGPLCAGEGSDGEESSGSCGWGRVAAEGRRMLRFRRGRVRSFEVALGVR